MELNIRALRFVELAKYLHRHNWNHFKLKQGGWPKNLNGEEQIFAVMIRAFLWNNIPSEGYFEAIGGYKGVMSKEQEGDNLEQWLKEKLCPFEIGRGEGSHRTNWGQRELTPRGLVAYLNVTRTGQKKYFDSFNDYSILFEELDKLPSVGPLTAFDMTKNLFEVGIIDLVPDRFYLTGRGEIKGIKALFPNVPKKDLIRNGTTLIASVKESTGMSEAEANFGVEDLLCIYQKKKDYKKYLKGELSVESFGSLLMRR